MQKKYSQFIIGIIVGAAGLFLITRLSGTQHAVFPKTVVADPAVKSDKKHGNLVEKPQEGIPPKVYSVLQYVRNNHHSMEGYEGGRVFSNREKIVPETDEEGKPIDYQEWDVNPKVRGQNRGSERILTGSDGRAWYTNNHYQSFTQIK